MNFCPGHRTSARVSKKAKFLGCNINSETGKWSLSYIMALDFVYLWHLAAGTGRFPQSKKYSKIKFLRKKIAK